MLNVMLIGLTLLIILGVAMLFYSVVKVTPEESFASAVMLILIVIYATGLCGNTAIGVYLLYGSAIVGVAAAVALSIQRKKALVLSFFTPGILMVIAVAGFGVIAFHGLQVCNWDELYQWGKAANYMVMYDQLPSGVNFSGESVLLSSTTFFHYFIARLDYVITGTIVESDYYVSNLLLWFSAILLPISGTTWKDRRRVWAYGIFHFLMTALLFVQPFYNIYTDQPTAYWAGAMIAWILMDKWNLRNVYLIPLVLVNVGLMKSMVGPLFAVIVIAALVTVHCIGRRNEGKRILPVGWYRKVLSWKGLLAIVAVASPFLLMGVWSARTGQNGLFRFTTSFFGDGQKERAVKTLKSMIDKAFQSVTLHDTRFYLTYAMFFVLTIGMVCAIAPLLLDRKRLAKYRGLAYLYMAGFAGYFLVMFVAYMTVFGYMDSIRAQSLNRYYADYMMLGIVPLTLPLFLPSGREDERSREFGVFVQKGFFVISLVMILYGSSTYLLSSMTHVYAVDTKKYQEREKLTKYAETVKQLTGEEGKIYFINQSKSGLYTLVADYEMDDQVSRGGMCYKFREKGTKQNSALTEYPIDTLPSVLTEQGYAYVWIYSSNDYLEENFKEMFDIKKIKNGDFYKVLGTEHGTVLEYIGNVQ